MTTACKSLKPGQLNRIVNRWMKDSNPLPDKPECVGFRRGGTHRCCDHAGEWRGFVSWQPFFDCPENCSCHRNSRIRRMQQ